jgi:hypothetical protein
MTMNAKKEQKKKRIAGDWKMKEEKNKVMGDSVWIRELDVRYGPAYGESPQSVSKYVRKK